jgi:nucleoside 2-deoxyribosyltransferase
MAKAVYVSSALGFTESGTQYYAGLLQRLCEEGFVVLDPWAFEGGESTKERQVYAELAGGTIPLEVCSEIGMRNVGLVDQADAVLAILDGTDVDSGVACEVGYAMAKGTPIIGLRTDRRRSGDSAGININLQVLHAVLRHELGDYVESVEHAIQSLHVAVSDPRAAT